MKHTNMNHMNMKRTTKMTSFAAGALCACVLITLPACSMLPHQADMSNAAGNLSAAELSNVYASKGALSYNTEAFQDKTSAYAADTSTTVLLDAEKVASSEIVKIIKHGDHWHVFTKDGREIITYSDPTKATQASDLSNTASVVSRATLQNMAVHVVKILKHGDHYHIFTNTGKEFITYANPSALYPHIPIGTYTGSHGSVQADYNTADQGFAADTPSEGALNAPDGMPSAQADLGASSEEHQEAHPNDASNANNPLGLSFVRVVKLSELAQMPITKILQHADHYHCYTAAGEEVITYDNPQAIFPEIRIGTYVGSHHSSGQSGTGSAYDNEHATAQSTPGTGNNPFDTPNTSHENSSSTGDSQGSSPHPAADENEVVKILKHEDHWHVYYKNGEERVTFTDPSALYPHIKIGEYYGTHTQPLKPLNHDEVFTYDSVEAKNIVPLDKMPWEDCKYMRFFDKEQQTFYVYHLAGERHAHSHAIRDIIQFAKSYPSDFHGFSARDVVATLKYRIEHADTWTLPADYENEYSALANNQATQRHITHIVKEIGDLRGLYVAYYDTGAPAVLTKLPQDTNIKPVRVLAVSEKSFNDIKNDVCKTYGITSDQFDALKLELPPCSLQGVRFNDDGTIEVHGKSYNMKEKLDQFKQENKRTAETNNNAEPISQAEHKASPAPEIAPPNESPVEHEATAVREAVSKVAHEATTASVSKVTHGRATDAVLR